MFFGRMRNDSTSWRFEGRVLKCHVGNLFLGLQDGAKWLRPQTVILGIPTMNSSKNIIKCKSGMFNNLMCQKFWAAYLNDHYLMPLKNLPPSHRKQLNVGKHQAWTTRWMLTLGCRLPAFCYSIHLQKESLSESFFLQLWYCWCFRNPITCVHYRGCRMPCK